VDTEVNGGAGASGNGRGTGDDDGDNDGGGDKRKLNAVAIFLSNCADNDRMRYLKNFDETRVISIKAFFLFYITKNKIHFFFRSPSPSAFIYLRFLKLFTWEIYIY
jgi:hypothetical protein